MSIGIDTTLEMNSGHEIPLLGLGVFRAGAGQPTYEAVRAALDVGYRHIDTAAIYGNEEPVGQAIRDSGVPREEVFVTTKLWNDDQGYDKALAAFDRSLSRLGLDYVDLYLMHWPRAGTRLDSWRAMEKIHASGRAKSMGVSNFARKHLDELLAACEIPPAINQFELHPYLQQRDMADACAAHGIVVEAYCPLVRARKADDPVLKGIAAQTGRTWAQVLVRWSLQKGYVVLPKSSRQERIAENADVYGFSLSDEQMAALNGLEEDFRLAWNPNTID